MPGEDGKVLPVGFLNDWDLCKYKESIEEGAVQADRSVGSS